MKYNFIEIISHFARKAMINFSYLKKSIVLSIFIFLTIAAITIFISNKIDSVIFNCVSVIGSVASVIGLIHVWFQVTEAITISKEYSRFKGKVLKNCEF